jgi:hypothetical protein
VLRTIEQKIESLVERTFGRAFRSRLQPVELARKLAREMEHNKTVSVSRVYVPNEFKVFLSGPDREEFRSFETSLGAELATYLGQHAKAEGFSMVAEPEVHFETDEDLRVGEFGIACRMAEAPPDPEPAISRREPPERRPLDSPTPATATASPSPDVGAGAAGAAIAGVAGAAAGSVAAASHDAQAAGLATPRPGAAEEPPAQDEAEPPDEGRGEPPDAKAPAEEPADDDSTQAADSEEESSEAIETPEGPEEPSRAAEPPAGEIEDAEAPDEAMAAQAAPPPPATAGPPTRIHEGLAAVSGTQVFSAEDAAEAGVPRETLTLVTPAGRRRVTKRVARLGRSRDCDIVVNDPNVSRRHAEIRHVGLDYVVVDLGSTNGIEVNGQTVSRHVLADGDVLVLGTTTIGIELS